MTTSRISGIIPLLFITLLCVGIVECGYLMFEHFVLDPVPRDQMGTSDTPEEKFEVKQLARKTAGYEVILKRNLFGASAGDKPAPPPVPEKTEVLMPTSLQIVLVGTITGSEGDERAIILDKTKRKQDIYTRGDEIQGALVKEIRRGKVILAQNGREEMLDISEAAKMRPRVPQPVAPAPSPVAPVMEPTRPETNMHPQETAPQQPPEPAVDNIEEGIDPNATQIRLSRVSHAARGRQPGKDNLRSNATQQQGNLNE